MGACGCADRSPDFTIVPTFAVTIYPGCDDCGAGVMLMIDNLDTMPEDVYRGLPDIREMISPEGLLTLKLIDPMELLEALRETDWALQDMGEREMLKALRSATSMRRVE
jgi:hypothetical protein